MKITYVEQTGRDVTTSWEVTPHTGYQFIGTIYEDECFVTEWHWYPYGQDSPRDVALSPALLAEARAKTWDVYHAYKARQQGAAA